jgi:hypothetical protein
MTSLNWLETYTKDLATAAKILADHCQDAGVGLTPRLAVPNDAPCAVHRARRNVLSIVTELQKLLVEPADVIQHLASQVRCISHFSAESHLIVLSRINYSRVYNG